MPSLRLRLAAVSLGLTLAFAAVTSPGQTPEATPAHTFTVSGRQFLMDGKPYQILSGEMHYPRVPRAYWRDRFRKARAMGLNTITTYVFWNLHEPRPGVYDFSGQNDIAEYIREAQQEGLNVILRPGPYVCAEWELGGYPSWLLKDRSLVLRSDDPKYIAAMNAGSRGWRRRSRRCCFRMAAPSSPCRSKTSTARSATITPTCERLETRWFRRRAGHQTFSTPPTVPTRFRTVRFPNCRRSSTSAPATRRTSFATLDQLRPDGPCMTGEYWAGWFDHWGEKHHETKRRHRSRGIFLEWMLRQGYSVSMYMFHGGTSFGWMNGANSNGTNYEPDTTSYDYDAPLDEKGEPRRKFFLFRDAITQVTGKQPPPMPLPYPVEVIRLRRSSSPRRCGAIFPRRSSPVSC